VSEGLRDLLASQLLKDNDDTKTNLRDITDIFLDPEDPIDQAAIAMALTGAGVVPAAGIKTLNTGRKAYNFLKNITMPIKASKKIDEDVLRKGGNAIKGGILGESAVDGANLIIEGVEGMAKGGLADIPAQNFNAGGIALLKLLYQGGKNIFKGKSGVKKPKTDAPSYATEGFGAFMPGYVKGTYKTIKDLVGPLPSGLTRTAVGVGIPTYAASALYDYFTDDDEVKVNLKTALDDSAAAEPEPETFIEKLQAMDPALSRALIAGGAKMLQPTEGPVRSFLGLGEFGEGFSESLAKSDAAKSDTTQLYEAYVRKAEQEGKEVLGPLEFASAIDLGRDERTQIKSELLDILKKRYDDDDLSLSDVKLITGKDPDGNDVIETADALLAKASQADLISVRNAILDQAAP
tara:strand:- start:3351 stop:4568 length:1218 start_codon:yes stop_codon:yes gene_type:complete